MKDEETVGDFYAQLCDIVKLSYGLGENISETKVVEKILRSLSQRFDSKVTAIEESQNGDSIRVDDLVASLQTYESRILWLKKKKSLALRSSKKDKEVVGESFDMESSDSEIMSLLTNNFHKFLKSSKRSSKIFSDVLSKGDSRGDSRIKQY